MEATLRDLRLTRPCRILLQVLLAKACHHTPPLNRLMARPIHRRPEVLPVAGHNSRPTHRWERCPMEEGEEATRHLTPLFRTNSSQATDPETLVPSHKKC